MRSRFNEGRLAGMSKKSDGDILAAKQQRSQRTLDDLLEAAMNIVEDADPEKFTGRALAQKSGYALGTLVKRLTSIDNAFLWAIEKGRDRHVATFKAIMDAHDPDAPLSILVEKFIDAFFTAIQRVNPKVIRFVEDRYVRKNRFSSQFFHYTDDLVMPYLAVVQRDVTRTFRRIDDDEAKLILRSTLAIIERPFVEGYEIAGTPRHKAISIDNLIRLLASDEGRHL